MTSVASQPRVDIVHRPTLNVQRSACLQQRARHPLLVLEREDKALDEPRILGGIVALQDADNLVNALTQRFQRFVDLIWIQMRVERGVFFVATRPALSDVDKGSGNRKTRVVLLDQFIQFEQTLLAREVI